MASLLIASWFVPHYVHAGGKPWFYQEEFGPAAMIACGHGYVNPDATTAPGLDAFLHLKRDALSCSDLSGVRTLPITSMQRAFRYLISTAGWTWRIQGHVAWSALTPLYALFYGITHASFGVAEVIGRGFDTFSDMIKSGDFDRFLVRPRSTTLQVAGRDFDGRIGRLIQAVVVLCWSLHALPIAWSAAKVAVVLDMAFGAICLFYGLFVLQATLSFWTVEGLEIMNAVTYGGTETAQYPLTIYRPWFRSIFTFLIPLACVNYLPAGLLFGRTHAALSTAPLLALCPIAGVLFLGFSLLCWRAGVRHYCSTGS